MANPSGPNITEYGGDGGSPFADYAGSGSSLNRITVFCGTETGASKTAYVVRGLEFDWFSGPRKDVFGSRTNDANPYTFAEGEKILSMKIRAERLVDRIEFITDKGKFAAGGQGGEEYNLDIGDGFIVGFEGRCGWDIDKLGVVFKG